MTTTSLSPRAWLGFAVLVYWVWRGWQVRRTAWTAPAWRRFLTILAVAVGVLVAGFAMGLGVDNGVYRHLTPIQHALYFYTLVAFVLVGSVSTVLLLQWFASGRRGPAWLTGPAA